jgi:hypothetical protein
MRMITTGLFMVLMIGGLIFGVFGAVDAATRPFDHWQQIGRSKAGWIVLQLLVLFPIANIAGIVAAVIYLTTVRPKLQAAAEGTPIP